MKIIMKIIMIMIIMVFVSVLGDLAVSLGLNPLYLMLPAAVNSSFLIMLNRMMMMKIMMKTMMMMILMTRSTSCCPLRWAFMVILKINDDDDDKWWWWRYWWWWIDVQSNDLPHVARCGEKFIYDGDENGFTDNDDDEDIENDDDDDDISGDLLLRIHAPGCLSDQCDCLQSLRFIIFTILLLFIIITIIITIFLHFLLIITVINHCNEIEYKASGFCQKVMTRHQLLWGLTKICNCVFKEVFFALFAYEQEQ